MSDKGAGQGILTFLPGLTARLLAVLRLAPPPPRRWLRQSKEENCAQTIVAMVSNEPLERVTRYAGTDGRLSVDDALGLMAMFGIRPTPMQASIVADFWPTLRRQWGGRTLRGMAFRKAGIGEKVGHAYYLFGDRIYDPGTGKFERLNQSTFKALDFVAFFPPS